MGIPVTCPPVFPSLPETKGATTHKELGYKVAREPPLGTGERGGLSSGLAWLPAPQPTLWPSPELVSCPGGHPLERPPVPCLLDLVWAWAYLGAQPGLGPVSVLAHCVLLPLLKQCLSGLRTGGSGQRLRPHQLPATLPLPMGLSGGWQLRGGGRLGWCHQRWAEEKTPSQEHGFSCH